MWWIIVGFIVGLIETWYFGWNWLPQSNAERVWDRLSTLLILIGVVFIVIKDTKEYIRKAIDKEISIHKRTHHD